jgi:hypothetical protein
MCLGHFFLFSPFSLLLSCVGCICVPCSPSCHPFSLPMGSKTETWLWRCLFQQCTACKWQSCDSQESCAVSSKSQWLSSIMVITWLKDLTLHCYLCPLGEQDASQLLSTCRLIKSRLQEAFAEKGSVKNVIDRRGADPVCWQWDYCAPYYKDWELGCAQVLPHSATSQFNCCVSWLSSDVEII